MTSKDISRLVALFEHGKSDKEIGLILGYAESYIRFCRCTLGLRRRKPYYTEMERREIGRLYHTGKSCQEIMTLYGCSYTTIHRYADKYIEQTKK